MKMDSMDWTVWIESWKLNKKVTIFENVSDRISKIRILALNQENFKFLFFINELPSCNSHFDHSRSHQTHLTCWLSFEKLVDVIVFNTLAQCSAIWDLGAPSLLLKVHQVLRWSFSKIYQTIKKTNCVPNFGFTRRSISKNMCLKTIEKMSSNYLVFWLIFQENKIVTL